MEVTYRSLFTTMPHLSTTIKLKRQSSPESRRCSTGSNQRSSTGSSQKFSESNNSSSSGGTFFSMPVLGSNKNSASTAPQRNQEWTTSDRAQRVAQDDDLQSLLAAEVKKSGVVTAAGYRAVHQKFMYSDVVDQEMNRTRRTTPTLKHSLFGSLVKNTFSHSCSNPQVVIAKKLSRCGSDSSKEAVSNIAPRRSSQVAPPTQKQRKALLQEPQKHQGKMTDSFFASIERLDKSHNCPYWEQEDDDDSNDSCSQGSLLSSSSLENNADDCVSSFRRESNGSLVLQDIFDEMDISSPCKNYHACPGPLGDTTTLSRLDSLFVNISQVNFDPYVSEVNVDPDTLSSKEETRDADDLKSFSQSSKNSDTDKCGWLPWPADEDLLVSFQSLDPEGSFLPWPDVSTNERARAA